MKRRTFSSPPRRVALFVTCMVDMIYPSVGMSTVELLEQQGIEVIFPEEQTCCGQPAFNAGYRDDARVLARRFMDIFEPLVRSGQVDAIVTPSGSCATMVSHFYEVIFEETTLSAERERAQFLGTVTFELSEFLVDVLGVTDVGAAGAGKMTYHACCHLLRELGVNDQPRALLDAVAGTELVELNGAEDCCGFGGLFAIKNAPISTSMGTSKVTNIVETGAEVVALCDVSCMTHINGLLSRNNYSCRAVHIADVLTNRSNESVQAQAPKLEESDPQLPRRWQDPHAE